VRPLLDEVECFSSVLVLGHQVRAVPSMFLRDNLLLLQAVLFTFAVVLALQPLRVTLSSQLQMLVLRV